MVLSAEAPFPANRRVPAGAGSVNHTVASPSLSEADGQRSTHISAARYCHLRFNMVGNNGPGTVTEKLLETPVGYRSIENSRRMREVDIKVILETDITR